MENAVEMYAEEKSTPANELKGFTKTFQKRSKDKKSEDQNVVDLLAYNRDQKLVFGAKLAQKLFKLGNVDRVYTSTNPDELTLKMINHYAKLGGVKVITLDLDNNELAQKLGKPFNISMATVRKAQ